MPWRAIASRLGVSPRFEPRNPMRSARVVSSVMRMMLGCTESSEAPAGLRGERGGCAAKHTSRISSTARTRNNRIRKRESSIARLPGTLPTLEAQRSKSELDREIHVARAALRDHGIAGRYVRCLADLPEVAAVIRSAQAIDYRRRSIRIGRTARKRVVGKVIEIPAIQDIKHLPTQLNVETLRDFRILHQCQIPLAQSWADQPVAAEIAHCTVARNIERRQRSAVIRITTWIGNSPVGIVLDHIQVGIARLVLDVSPIPRRADTRTGQALSRMLVTAQGRGEGPPADGSVDRADLPSIAQP